MTTTVEPQVVGEPAGTGASIVTGVARRSTSAAMTTAGVVRDVLIVVGGAGVWRDVALGAACEAGDAAGRWIGDLRRADAQRRARTAVLAERGARERALRRRRAAEAVDAAVSAVAGSSIVNRVVDAQIERILRPVVLTVLDEVLTVLEQQPERIQAVLHGQRNTMVDELVSRVRAGAATGDTAVDRWTSRMLRRGPQPAAAPVGDP
jgi:hypothetical protein